MNAMVLEDSRAGRDCEKSFDEPLTWSVAVDTEVVPLCIADGLQNHRFALAVFASL